jgi:hypothetical protein
MTSLASSPLLVVGRLVTLAANGDLWRNLLPTLEESFGGLALGLIVGICGGVPMARSRFAASMLDPHVTGINGVPRVALGPFFVVWFGIGILPKILLAVSIVFVVVLFNTREGIESIDPDLVDALRSMRASPWQMLPHVTIPSLVPWLLASTKDGAPGYGRRGDADVLCGACGRATASGVAAENSNAMTPTPGAGGEPMQRNASVRRQGPLHFALDSRFAGTTRMRSRWTPLVQKTWLGKQRRP